MLANIIVMRLEGRELVVLITSYTEVMVILAVWGKQQKREDRLFWYMIKCLQHINVTVLVCYRKLWIECELRIRCY